MYRYHYHYHYQYYYHCYCHFVIIIVIIYFWITQHWRRKGQDKTINDTIINNLNKKTNSQKQSLGKKRLWNKMFYFKIKYLKSIKIECNGFQISKYTDISKVRMLLTSAFLDTWHRYYNPGSERWNSKGKDSFCPLNQVFKGWSYQSDSPTNRRRQLQHRRYSVGVNCASYLDS